MDELYINIGSGKSCCFVKMSVFLMKKLEIYPLLFYAMEEATKCAGLGYYGIGIITFSQLLNLFDRATPEDRHIVAHEILRQKPTREMYESIVDSFKEAATERSDQECAKCKNIEEYQQKVIEDWKILMKNLHGMQL